MAVLRFFKLPKHQQYEYKPRFWDPRKEELQERLRQLDEMKGDSADAVRARLASGGLRRGFHADSGRVRNRQVMRSNLVLLAIIIALLVLSYLILMVYLPEIVRVVDPGAAN